MRPLLPAIALTFGTLAAAPALGVEVLESVFQVTYTYAGEEHVFTDTIVPLLPDNACYTWYIRLDAGDAPTSATEILTLPVALDDWGDLADNPDDGIDISADGKVATRLFDPAPDPEGWFSNSWCAVEGDPIGAHRIEVLIAGDSVASYDFQVVQPQDYSWPSIRQPTLRERSVDNSW